MRKFEWTRHAEADCWCKCPDSEHRRRKAVGEESVAWPLIMPAGLVSDWILACARCDQAFADATTKALDKMTRAKSQRERERIAAQLDARLAQLGIVRISTLK
ncbi:MAG TPA: hypothetical protein VEK57_31375 [Thermoanaerobaculia bacterium]|nr:hypothetical protein [Thermoanaerobaculia bacterium]